MTGATQARYRKLVELTDSLPTNNRIRQECAAALNQIDEQAREIERLRAGILELALDGNWSSNEDVASDGTDTFQWRCDGKIPNPAKFARELLEAKP